MRPQQWQVFKQAAKRQAGAAVPLALIVDSPWIPGYLGISHLDFFLDPEVWFQANLRVLQEFPDIIFFQFDPRYVFMVPDSQLLKTERF